MIIIMFYVYNTSMWYLYTPRLVFGVSISDALGHDAAAGYYNKHFICTYRVIPI